jgi:hypothetical protein
MERKKGLLCWVYSSGENCILNAVRSDTVVLTGENIPELFEESDDCPAVEVVNRNLSFMKEPYKTAYMVGKKDGACFGGKFIYSGDSRFRELVSEYPVPLHDRYEG